MNDSNFQIQNDFRNDFDCQQFDMLWEKEFEKIEFHKIFDEIESIEIPETSSIKSETSIIKCPRSNRVEELDENIKRGRKRKYEDYRYRRRINPFRKIPKRDIRRDYAMMHINAFNSGDPYIFQQFIKQYCIPTCKLFLSHAYPTYQHHNQHHNYNQHQSYTSQGSFKDNNKDCLKIYVQGYHEMMIPYHIMTIIYPDLIYTLQGYELIQRKDDDHVEIVCKVRMHGTDPTSQISLIKHSHSLQMLSISSYYDSFISYLQNNHIMNSDGEISMIVNKEYQITSITIRNIPHQQTTF